MEIIKASLMAAIAGGSGGANVAPKPDTVVRNGTYYSSTDHLAGYTQFTVAVPDICDEIKAMPICGSEVISGAYAFYLKSGLLSEQAESVQQMTFTNQQSPIFFPSVIAHPKYFYLCVYPSNANPDVDDFYEAISCSAFSNNNYLQTYVWNASKQDLSGYYMRQTQYPTGYGASIAVRPDAQRLSIYVSIALSGAYTTKQYNEAGEETWQTEDAISATQTLDIGRAITGTGYEAYTKLSQNQYEDYLRGIAQYAYNSH